MAHTVIVGGLMPRRATAKSLSIPDVKAMQTTLKPTKNARTIVAMREV